MSLPVLDLLADRSVVHSSARPEFALYLAAPLAIAAAKNEDTWN